MYRRKVTRRKYVKRTKKSYKKNTYKRKYKKRYAKRSSIATTTGGRKSSKRFGKRRVGGSAGFASQTLISNIVTSDSTPQGAQNFFDVVYGDATYYAGSLQGHLGQMLQSSIKNVVTAATGSGSQTSNISFQRVFVKSITQEISYVNSNMHPMFLTLYDCKLKTDLVGVLNNITPLGAMIDSQSVDGDVNITGFNSSFLNVGWEPTMCTLFNKGWYVAGRKDVILAPGETHIHHVTCNINRIFDATSILLQNNGSVPGFSGTGLLKKGFAGATLCRYRMGPVVGLTSGLNYGQGVIHCTQTSKLYFSAAKSVLLPSHAAQSLSTNIVGPEKYVVPSGMGVMQEGHGIIDGAGGV